MASFKVGQRCRVVSKKGLPELFGKECTIMGIGEFFGICGAPFAYDILVDGYGYQHVCNGDELEPLTDTGAESITDKLMKMPGAGYDIAEWDKAWGRA